MSAKILKFWQKLFQIKRAYQNLADVICERSLRYNWAKFIPNMGVAAPKGVARIFGRGSAIWREATDSATCSASEAVRSAADRATAVVMGRNPLREFEGKAL